MVLYADTVEIGDRVASVAASEFERTDTLRRFGVALRRGGVGIAAFVNFRKEEALRLRDACNGSLIDPACVVVTPCRFEAVRQFRSLGLKPLRERVVWLEEVEDRLPQVLRVLLNPLTPFGHGIIVEHQPRAVVKKALSRICRIGGGTPPRSVAELAQSLYIEASPLRSYWATDIPLRCGPKELLKWALLFWAIEERAGGASWHGVARCVGRSPRTLRRYASDLAGCGLAAAAGSPDTVRLRFEAWAREVELGR